ncbi:MAG: TonB-dependent receptor domain-containing protein [Pseudohongiellaceae bacterium]
MHTHNNRSFTHTHSRLWQALASVLLLVAASLGTAPATLAQETIEEVVVTGSRIARDPNLTNVSPVMAVNAEEFLYQGVVRTEDLLNDLPSIYAAQQSGQANGATGTATVSLRGLGTLRTLVLVNGRRLPAGTSGQGGEAADINQIPASLIERVDVLTGGSSAAYGSDAIAGVVNFLTVRNFEGVRLDVQTGGYRHKNDNGYIQSLLESRRTGLAANSDPSAAGYETPPANVSDGELNTYSLIFGANAASGRGNVTGYYSYRDIGAVLQRDRDYSRCDLNGNPAAGTASCGGSGTIPNGRFTDFGSLSGAVIARPAGGMCPANSVEFTQSGSNYCYLGAAPQPTTGEMAGMCPMGQNEIRMGNTVVGCANNSFPHDYIPGTGSDAGTFQRRPGTLLYNYNPTNFYQRPDEQHSAGFFAHYEVADGHEVYGEFNYNDNHTAAQIAFSGNFFVTTDLSCGNPLMSDAQFETMCGQLGLTRMQNISDLDLYSPNIITDDNGTPDDATDDTTYIEGVTAGSLADPGNPLLFTGKRNVEGGPRSDDLRHTSLRTVFGARGELPNTWNYDFYALFSEVSLEETYNNDLSITRIQRSQDVVPYDHDNDPATDPIARCRSVAEGYDTACVPWNLFYGQGFTNTDRNGDGVIDHHDGIVPAATNWLALPLYNRGTTDQKVFSGYIAGDLGQYGWQFPSASTGVEFAFGLEYRSINLINNPDSNFQSGDGAGQGGATLPIAGGWDVDEWFTEVNIPIVDGLNGIQDLRAEVAYRSSSYSTGQDTSTYKVGLAYKPIDDLTLRATLQRAVRHASVYELFLAQGNNLTNISDPCSTDDRNEAGAMAATLAQCMLTGVTAAQYNANNVPTSPAGQYNFLQGGNENLAPEESDTFSFGIIYSPSQVDGLDITLDYFDITVEKAIASISSQTILDECLGGNTSLCGFINRGPNGNLWLGNPGEASYGYIEGLQTNIGFFGTTGFDITASYDIPLNDMGRLNLSTTATYLTSWEQEEFPGAGVIECVGTWSGSCGDPTFELVNNFRATWHTNWDLDVSLSWRYLPDVMSNNSSHSNLDATNYLDIAAIWEPVEGLTLRGGVNNLLDQEPPLYGQGSESFGNGNTWPGLYDALGQYAFAGLTYNFSQD